MAINQQFPVMLVVTEILKAPVTVPLELCRRGFRSVKDSITDARNSGRDNQDYYGHVHSSSFSPYGAYQNYYGHSVQSTGICYSAGPTVTRAYNPYYGQTGCTNYPSYPSNYASSNYARMSR